MRKVKRWGHLIRITERRYMNCARPSIFSYFKPNRNGLIRNSITNISISIMVIAICYAVQDRLWESVLINHGVRVEQCPKWIYNWAAKRHFCVCYPLGLWLYIDIFSNNRFFSDPLFIDIFYSAKSFSERCWAYIFNIRL